ncbi:hypothetical protein FTW19_17690 [Terriglobus albidus]|uniref:Uncharacterized protein n=1 Tax=Terriglobus albidus TaxID=1592106 RepID=A0A5B9EH41_9BACT|nr:hypothetical protein [Terriglobus albidus]QEE29657.1 hypothetical protein FTW19_17690 [Terriglobus albidus]
MPLRVRSGSRPNYFTGQLLDQQDFQDEQAYHLALQKNHGATLHTPGILSGLELLRIDDVTVAITPGAAIDAKGNSLMLPAAQKLSLQPANGNATSFVTLAYAEEFQESDAAKDNAGSYTRHAELCVISEAIEAPRLDSPELLLGRVQFAGGRISAIDISARPLAGARLAPGSVGGNELAAASVTLAKLRPELRSGWVRMAFKPSSFVEPSKTAQDFYVGVTKTYCDQRGAKGTISIPVPMMADRLKTFVIAGERNAAGIQLELDRSGWDATRNSHEKTTLLSATVAPAAPFYQSFAINKQLDAGNHCIALYVEAIGDCSISLIAAEFEFSLK